MLGAPFPRSWLHCPFRALWPRLCWREPTCCGIASLGWLLLSPNGQLCKMSRAVLAPALVCLWQGMGPTRRFSLGEVMRFETRLQGVGSGGCSCWPMLGRGSERQARPGRAPARRDLRPPSVLIHLFGVCWKLLLPGDTDVSTEICPLELTVFLGRV